MTLHWMLPSLITAVALMLTGCAHEPATFIEQATSEGIEVFQPESAELVVERICDNMDHGRGPWLHAMPAEVLNVPISSDDLRLLRIGVEAECDEHARAYNGILDSISRSAEQYDSEWQNVGPDGICVGTPCGNRGKMPEGVPVP